MLLLFLLAGNVSAQNNNPTPVLAETEKTISYFFIDNLSDVSQSAALEKILLAYNGKIISVEIFTEKKIVKIVHHSFFSYSELLQILNSEGFKSHYFTSPPDLTKRYEFNQNGQYKVY
jgi:hypothetical protein